MKKGIGYIGLGKMGLAQMERLVEKGWRVVAWSRSEPPRAAARRLGADVSESLADVCKKLKRPRLVWLMMPHVVVDEVLKKLMPHLSKSDTVIDGGNSFYKNSQRRANELARRGIHFLDVGVSGGPSGARNGACLMIGGDKRIFRKHEQLFKDMSATVVGSTTAPQYKHTDKLEFVGMSQLGGGSYAYVGGSGVGHFVKMVHNGIEYGTMQAIAEGFAILRAADERRYQPQMNADTSHPPQSPLGKGGRRTKMNERGFGLNLTQIAELYNQGSVIESRLVGWLAKAFKEHGEDLKDISGEVGQLGEGKWTVDTAKEFGVPVKVIEDSLDFRFASQGNPSYTGQVVSALRNQFGGHSVSKKKAS